MEIMNGVPVVCVEGLIRMKKKLGREKDLADIVLMEKAKKVGLCRRDYFGGDGRNKGCRRDCPAFWAWE